MKPHFLFEALCLNVTRVSQTFVQLDETRGARGFLCVVHRCWREGETLGLQRLPVQPCYFDVCCRADLFPVAMSSSRKGVNSWKGRAAVNKPTARLSAASRGLFDQKLTETSRISETAVCSCMKSVFQGLNWRNVRLSSLCSLAWCSEIQVLNTFNHNVFKIKIIIRFID